MLYYGLNLCLSTFLEFGATGEFEFIRQTLADLEFCTLDEKQLKPIKPRVKQQPGKK